MNKSDDFYCQQIAQVKMDRWSKGNVVLLGDAAYCPSPISGVVSMVDRDCDCMLTGLIRELDLLSSLRTCLLVKLAVAR